MRAVLLMAALAALPLANADTASSAPANVVRRFPSTSVSGAETFRVTITFSAPADSFNAIGLSEFAPAGWTLAADRTWCSPAADASTVKANEVDYIWFGPASGYPQGAAFNAVYQVTVPAGTAGGTYSFNGKLEYYLGGGSAITETVGGVSSVTVPGAPGATAPASTTPPPTTSAPPPAPPPPAPPPTTGVVAAQQMGPPLLQPRGGATGVPTTPGFSWSPFAGARTYEVILATDAAFRNLVAGTPVRVSTPSWQPAQPLQAGATYCWSVRVVEPTTSPVSIGTFTVAGAATKPASAPSKSAFSVSFLGVSAAEVGPGQPVVVTCQLTNNGSKQARETVVLKVNGASEGTRDLTLNPGSSERITFTVSRSAVGSYALDVNGTAAAFRVKEGVVAPAPAVAQTPRPTASAQSPPQAQSAAGWFITGAIVVALAIGGLLAFLFLGRRSGIRGASGKRLLR